MGSDLYNKIQNDLTLKIKSREDALGVSVLRLLLAAMKNKAIDKGSELNNDEVIAIVKKGVKERQDAIEQYTKAERSELAQKETQELDILRQYLPQELSEKEVEDIVNVVLQEKKDLIDPAQASKSFGVIMKEVMARATGTGKTVNGAQVSALLKTKLQ